MERASSFSTGNSEQYQRVKFNDRAFTPSAIIMKRKQFIVREFERRQVPSSKENIESLADWAYCKLNLHKLSGERTMRQIFNQQDLVRIECDAGHATRKQILRVQNETVERKLLNWVYDMWEKEAYICDYIIQEKARRIYAELYADSAQPFFGHNYVRGGFIVLRNVIDLNDTAHMVRLVKLIGKKLKGNPLYREKLFNFCVI